MRDKRRKEMQVDRDRKGKSERRKGDREKETYKQRQTNKQNQ